MELGKREKFLKVYASLPLGIRQEVVFVLDDGRTLNWDAVFFEVDNNTKLSEDILDRLEKLEII